MSNDADAQILALIEQESEIVMEFQLRQQGRASMDFLVALTSAMGPLNARWSKELAEAGVDASSLPEDIDQRYAAISTALSKSKAFAASGLLMDFASVEHGRIARDAYEESRDLLEPELDKLENQGPANLHADLAFTQPDYHKDVWFHRTEGGWDGHPQQGFIHGELIHRHYVSKNFPGDIFVQRRRVLQELPRQDYRRILEMGTSSGHFTVALQQTFPQAQITGVDVSLPMLKQALRVANENGWNWDLHQRAAEDTGFADASFDLVASYIIFHEMPQQAIEGVFAEAWRVLEPGGQMLMSDVTPYAAMDRMAAWRADWMAANGGEPYWREAASMDWKAAAEAAGFIDVESRGIDGAPYPWIVTGTKPHG
ncbi:MAG: class I SAM-dependent methyltransferase [Sphingomonadaceae bacterium]|nr:class I SAM-dependent methyltransferase [Sphingomonadaceae bacterium]